MRRPKHLGLAMEVKRASVAAELAFSASESVELSILPMLILVERRISDAELDELDELSATLSDEPSWRELMDFRIKYWALLARASRNPIVQGQLLGWMRAISELEPSYESATTRTSCSRYRGLARVLRQRSGTVEYWIEALDPLLQASELRLQRQAHRS